LSFVDGLANTRAMAAAGSELAQRILDLRIAGRDDWYLPALDETERLYRNLHAMTSLMQAGVDFIAADNPHANKLTIHLLAAIAEHERDLISDRTTAALRAAKRRGVKLGSPSPMHGNKLGVATLIRQADDFAVKVMPIVRELKRHGYSTLREIARGLSDRGIQTPRGNANWHPSQVANLLKRRA